MRHNVARSISFLGLVVLAVPALAQESSETPKLEVKPLTMIAAAGENLKFLILSRDGKLLATVSEPSETTVNLWNAMSGKPLGTLKGKKNVNCAAFTTDAKTLIVGDDGGMINVWDIAERKLRKSFVATGGIVFSTGVSNDGKLTLVGMLETAPALFNTATGKQIGVKRNQKGMTRVVAPTPKSGMLVSGNDSGQIQFFDEKTGKERRSIELGDDNGIRTLQFSPDEKTLAVDAGRALYLVDVESGKPTLLAEEAGDCLAFTADGKSLVVASPPYVTVWDLKAKKPIGQARIDNLGGRDRASLSADGSIAAFVVGKKEVQVLEIPSAKTK